MTLPLTTKRRAHSTQLRIGVFLDDQKDSEIRTSGIVFSSFVWNFLTLLFSLLDGTMR